MKINWQKYLRIIKKVTIFIIGSLVVSLGISVFLYEYLGNYLNQLSEAQIKEMAANPFSEITRTSFNIYLIAYILFGQLPDKIKKASAFPRCIYFLLFYLFCYIVSIWI